MLLEFSKRIQRRISHGSNVCFVQHLCLLLCVRKSASQSISLLLTIVVTMLTAFNDIQAEHANIWRDELSFCIWEVWIPETLYLYNVKVLSCRCESIKFYLRDCSCCESCRHEISWTARSQNKMGRQRIQLFSSNIIVPWNMNAEIWKKPKERIFENIV